MLSLGNFLLLSLRSMTTNLKDRSFMVTSDSSFRKHSCRQGHYSPILHSLRWYWMYPSRMSLFSLRCMQSIN